MYHTDTIFLSVFLFCCYLLLLMFFLVYFFVICSTPIFCFPILFLFAIADGFSRVHVKCMVYTKYVLLLLFFSRKLFACVLYVLRVYVSNSMKSNIMKLVLAKRVIENCEIIMKHAVCASI